MYCNIIRAMISYEQGNKIASLAYTEAVFEHVRQLILHLFDNMNEPNVSRAIWVRHVSGIHSWGLTSDTEHGPVEFGGLSGSQTLIFLAVDAFLGIDQYHSEEEIRMHISKNMRNVFAAMKRHCFRPQLAKGGSAEDLAIIEVMDRIVKQMRVLHSSFFALLKLSNFFLCTDIPWCPQSSSRSVPFRSCTRASAHDGCALCSR